MSLYRFISLKISNLRNDTWLIIFSIILATVFWLFATLSNIYSETLEYKVSYKNLPDNIVLTNPPINKIQLDVKGKGWNLILSHLKQRKSVKIDLQALKLRPYILTKYLLKEINHQFSNDYEIIDVVPDTIFFPFEKKIVKKIPVQFKSEISFAKQFDLADNILIEPDSIFIEGPKNIIDSTHSWPTTTLKLQELKNKVDTNLLLLKSPVFAVKLSTNKVKVHLTVEEFTESKISIPIDIIQSNKTTSYVIYPKKIIITYQVPLSKYENVLPALFKSEVNLDDLTSSNTTTLPINLKYSPDFLKRIQFEPKFVECIKYE